ncbi:hypothetical protein WMY93_012039 [Mugilogobius chulae]|uniref:Uncharacterized protein n=1 Tax=Mugilogobius chulae TaxID=88201 RepID=A0AAW0PAF3_9GOBI
MNESAIAAEKALTALMFAVQQNVTEPFDPKVEEFLSSAAKSAADTANQAATAVEKAGASLKAATAEEADRLSNEANLSGIEATGSTNRTVDFASKVLSTTKSPTEKRAAIAAAAAAASVSSTAAATAGATAATVALATTGPLSDKAKVAAEKAFRAAEEAARIAEAEQQLHLKQN